MTGAQQTFPTTLTRRRAVASAAVMLVILTAITAPPPAWAIDYPTWAEVSAARSSEAATKTKIAEIESLLAGLQTAVDSTQAEAVAQGELYQAADQAFQEAALKADNLDAQAVEAEELAEESMGSAGALVAQLYRSGEGDLATSLFINASTADDILYSYGLAEKVTEQTARIYEKAVQDQNSARSLTDQADLAKTVREELRAEAEIAFQAAQEAADAALAAFDAQQEYQNLLSAQLVVLTERRAATEADYLAGVKAAADAAAQLGAGAISASGWAKPGGGRITSQFGYRPNPFGGTGTSYHLGVDFSAGCGAAVFAAHGGTVTYSGWNGVYGNYIQISNGDGVSTAYGHIQNGGLLVRKGETVGVGQQIARAGATGGATGCHIHLGILLNGVVTDPIAYLRNQGVSV
jgi:murein DD-endopeptidase MepM/ murein hydrolase activator NlpD